MAGYVKFTRNGDVIHTNTDTLLGHWKKVPDPQYKAGTFLFWKTDETEDQGKTYYPRQIGYRHFSEELEALEEAEIHAQLGEDELDAGPA